MCCVTMLGRFICNKYFLNFFGDHRLFHSSFCRHIPTKWGRQTPYSTGFSAMYTTTLRYYTCTLFTYTHFDLKNVKSRADLSTNMHWSVLYTYIIHKKTQESKNQKNCNIRNKMKRYVLRYAWDSKWCTATRPKFT